MDDHGKDERKPLTPDDMAVELVGLGKDVAALRSVLDTVSGRLDALDRPAQIEWTGEGDPPPPGDVPQLRANLLDLAEQVAQIGDAVAEGAPGAPGDYRPWCWVTLSAEEAEKAWAQLREWIDKVLAVRYPELIGNNDVPPCWDQHPPVVEELSWLYTYWLWAYVDKEATPSRAAEWHDRWLPGVLSRIKQRWAGACQNGEHSSYGGRRQAAAVDPSKPWEAVDVER